MILDPQNIGLDTLIIELCAILAKIWQKYIFSSNGVTNLHKNGMWDIFNIANRFL